MSFLDDSLCEPSYATIGMTVLCVKMKHANQLLFLTRYKIASRFSSCFDCKACFLAFFINGSDVIALNFSVEMCVLWLHALFEGKIFGITFFSYKLS